MFELTEQEQLLLWRKRNKVPLKIVAEYIGCSQSLISRWECGLLNMADEKVSLYRKFIKKYENN